MLTRSRLAARRERALPNVAGALARSVRTGSTLHAAFAEVAASESGPLAEELSAVHTAVVRGRSLEESLQAWSDHADSPSVDLLVAACAFGIRDGGDLAAALDGAAVTLIDRLDVADEARAATSQARSSAMVLVALPVFGAVMFGMLDPAVATTLIATSAGRLCLVIGAVLDGAAAWVMAFLVRRALR